MNFINLPNSDMPTSCTYYSLYTFIVCKYIFIQIYIVNKYIYTTLTKPAVENKNRAKLSDPSLSKYFISHN